MKRLFLIFSLLLMFSPYCFSIDDVSGVQKKPGFILVEPKTIKMRHAQDVLIRVENGQVDMPLSITPGGAYVQSELQIGENLISIDQAGYSWVASKSQVTVYKNNASGFEIVRTLDLKNKFQKIVLNEQKLIAINGSQLAFFLFNDNFNIIDNYRIQLDANVVNASLSASHACLLLANKQLLRLDLKSKKIVRSEHDADVMTDHINAVKNACISASKKKITQWKQKNGKLIVDSVYRSGRFVNDVLTTDSNVILANGNAGITILDLNNKLQWLGSYNKLGNISRVAVWGDQLLAADDRGAITLFDISQVENPLLMSDFHLHEKIVDLSFVGDMAYALVKNKLMTIDFSVSSSPIISTLGVNQGGSRRSFIEGDILYVADWFSGLHLYDISIPRAPRLLSSYPTPGSPKGVVVRDSVAFVADDDHGLLMVDVSDPHNPVYLSDLPLSGLAYTMKLVGDLLYIASHHGGFHIVDVSDASRPKLLGSYDTPSKAWALEYQLGLLYVADDSSGLMVFDVENPAEPKLINQFNPGGFAEDVVLKNNKAYIAFFDLGLMVLDISDPLNLRLLSTLQTPGNARGIEIQGELLYLASWEAGVHIVDISNSNSLEVVGHYDTRGATWGLSVKKPMLYAMDWWGGVKVLDVSNKMNPTFIGQYQAAGKIKDILYDEGFIYTAHGSRGLQVYDASNSLNPVWATGLDFFGDARRVVLNDNLALIAGGDGGLVIVDISNPFQVKWLGQMLLPSSADFVQTIAHTAFVATKNGDTYIVDVSSPKEPRLVERRSAMTLAMKSSGQSLFHLNKGGEVRKYSANNTANLWRARSMAVNFDASHMAIVGQSFFIGGSDGQIIRYQIERDQLNVMAKFRLPEVLIALHVHEKKLYVTAKSNKLYVFDIAEKNAIQVEYVYPATHEIERISVSKDGIFFSGESSIASGKLLPDVMVSYENGEYTAKIPANMPLGAYNLGISNASGERYLFRNAFSVAFPKLKSKFTMEDFKKKLSEKNLPGKVSVQP